MEPRNRFQGMNSASLFSLAGRYDNPIPTRCLAPIDFLKIPVNEEPVPGIWCLKLKTFSFCFLFKKLQYIYPEASLKDRRSIQPPKALLRNCNYFLQFRFRILTSYGSSSNFWQVTSPVPYRIWHFYIVSYFTRKKEMFHQKNVN